MSNEFNAKNGLRIQWSQPVSGITNNTLINNDNRLATEGQIYRELTAKTDNSVFASYTASTATANTTNFVNVTGDTMTGTLYLPTLSATTISGDTIYGNNIPNTYVVYSNNNILTGNIGLVYSGGNLGIGISNPTYKLHILDVTNEFKVDSGRAYFGVTGSTSRAIIKTNGGTAYFTTSTSSTPLYLTVDESTDKGIYISTTGNVGVGTSAPSVKLQVLGGISGTTISGDTFYGNGANISGIAHNTVVTGLQGGTSGQYYHLTQAEYSAISGSGADGRYVNITGDTMTGGLVTPSLSGTTISGDTIYQNNEKVATENFAIAMVIALG